MAEPLFQAVSGAAARYPDRYFALSAIATPEMQRRYEAAGVGVFEDPWRAVESIAAAVRAAERLNAPPLPVPPVPQNLPPLPKGRIAEHEAKRILAEAGIPVLERGAGDQRRARPPTPAPAIGERLVLKIVSPDIPHKTEIGGVMLDVPAAEAGAAYDRMIERVKARAPRATIDGVLLSPMVRGGVEMILGVQNDPVFGPVVMLGLRRHLRRGVARRDLPHRAVRGRGGAPHDRRIARPGDARRARAASRPATSMRWRRRCRNCRCSSPPRAPSSPASTSTRCWCARRARARRRSTR